MRAFGNYSLFWLQLDSLCTAQIYRFLAGALLLARVSVALEHLNLLQQTSARAPELLGSCSFCFFAIPKTNQKQLIVCEFPIYFWLIALLGDGSLWHSKGFFLTCTPTCPAFFTPPPALFARPEIAQALLLRRNHHGKWIVSRRAIEQAGTLCRVPIVSLPNDSRCPEILLRWYSRERALFY